MGQNISNHEIDVFHNLDYNELTTYMELTYYKNLKEGEKYRLCFKSLDRDLIFCYYTYRGKIGYCENCDAIFKDNHSNYYTVSNCWTYYRFISKKEYNEKIRDKFNEKVLNTVLKQIINDEFKW